MAEGLLLLECPLQRYAWGSPTALPALLGEENPRGEPWAELWMGAHPAAPSAARTECGSLSLGELVARDPGAHLGRGVAARFGGELPFLLKVLAASEPLSIQCHPDREQARAGFEREEAAGIPRDAPERSYRDRNHKPELLVAESPFSALAGFRRPEDIDAQIGDLQIDELAPERQDLARSGDLRAFFAALMAMGAERRGRVLAQASRSAKRASSRSAALVAELLRRHPGDIGALAPLYLNLVELAPGEGLFLPARQLHSYLEGVGVEIMASSDNVLRAGLTSKHVAVRELVSILDFEPRRPAILRAEPRGGAHVYPAQAEEFELLRVDVHEGQAFDLETRGSAAIAFCIEGTVRLVDRAGAGALELSQGGAAWVSAAVERASLEGRGRVYAARVPAPEE